MISDTNESRHPRGSAKSRHVDELAAEYVRRFAEAAPVEATLLGLDVRPQGLTDYGPQGMAARVDLARGLLASVSVACPRDHQDSITTRTIRERLEAQLGWLDAGEWMRDLRVMGGPHNDVRQFFQLLPRGTSSDWVALLELLRGVPDTIASIELSLRRGVQTGAVAGRRQTLACASQAAIIGHGWFSTFVRQHGHLPDGRLPRGLGESLNTAANAADRAYGELADYLRNDYAALATTVDGVGRERYGLACRLQNGVVLDFDETYAWAWDELGRIDAEMMSVANQIRPGSGADEAIHLLENDPARSVAGFNAFVGWLQDRLDAAVDALAGVHFEIPGPVRALEVQPAPPGSAAAPYYTRPSAGFSRPGRVWWPDLGRPRVPLWIEVTTAFHEGVPGHHLQLGHTTWLGNRLNPFRSHLGATSGFIEGWALYAERLMGELGFLETPDWQLGMLAEQAHRTARVIVDIGLHLGLRIPGDQPDGGELWTAERAESFMVATGRRPHAFMGSEIVRYLSWPAQAIGYKVGERAWLDARAQVRARARAAFDLRRFHQQALELGMVGLGQLEPELLALQDPQHRTAP